MGSPLFRWLAGLDADRLAEILVRRPDVAAPFPRDLPTLARRLQERDSVTLAFYGLPLPAIQLVAVIRAIGGQTVSVDQLARALRRTTDDPDLCATLRLLAQHALVWPDPDGGVLNMAAPLWPVYPYSRRLGPPPEPGDTPRNPQWQPRFDPQPPPTGLVRIEPGAVEREAAAAATSTVERTAALLAICSVTPVPVLKSGGVGVRELRRLGKVLACEEVEVRLSLELAHAAGLLAAVRDQVLPTEAYDRWRADEPAGQLVTLLRAWRQLRAAPLTPGVTDAAPPAALLHDPAGLFAHHLRPHVLQVAAELPAGQGATGAGPVEDIMVWQSPMLVGPMPARSELVAGLWQEAGLLGAIAHGALTPLGRALLHESGDHHGCHECASNLEQAARRLLPPAVRTAMFQADLTAVVPGMPATDLAESLDAVADRQSRGGAAIWRFSPASVRRALDTGQDAEAILTRLREFAADGALPQPLGYLVHDVARRHGSVRVRAAACVLRTQDPALAAEIAATRSLSALELALVAPTVLVSARPVAESLAALRSAGYAPIGESGDGYACVEPIPRHRAPAQRHRSPAVATQPGIPSGVSRQSEDPSMDTVALAVRLLASQANAPADPACAASPNAPVEPDGLTNPDASTGWDSLDGPEFLDALVGRDIPAGFDLDPTEYANDAHDEYALPTALTPAEVDELVADVVRYASHLTTTELEQLATALAFCTPVRIRYTNASGVASVRVIHPIDLAGRRLVAWCDLRDDERVFVLERIDAVTPV